MKKTFCALAILSATSVPVLAAPVDVPVTGTIEPVACTLSMPLGLTIDFEVISPTTLDANNYTVLPEREIDITLNCDAPTKMGLMAVDKRPGSMAGVTPGPSGAALVPAPVELFGRPTTEGVGLGLDGTDKIGGYAIRLVAGKVTVDGNTVRLISNTPSGTDASWGDNSTGSLYLSTDKRYLSWAAPSTLVPIAFESMTGKIGVQAYINKKSELDVSKPIKLDGMTTLELVYL